ncbi:glycosyltransferase [Vibrio splendidus]
MLHSLKNAIKSNSLTKAIYLKVQSFLILLQYKLIVRYYKNKTPTCNRSLTCDVESKKPVVFYFGGDELQDKSGFLQALSTVSDVTYFTKEDNSYGSYSFGILNKNKNVSKNRKRLLELLDKMETTPDILLMQTWEWRIGLETLQQVKKLYPKLKIVNIAMDDRHSYWIYGMKNLGSAGLIPALDAVFTTSSEAVEWYKKEGVNAFFYPLASEPLIFHPINIPKIHDVGFVGAKYGIREVIVEKLIDKGINVKAYGNGWESGRLPIDDTNKFYNQCRIVLGVGTILGCNDFTSMKLRDFDVPMSGSVYLTNYNQDTAEIFAEESEICFYRNVDECVAVVSELLSNERKLHQIRENTLLKALENTYIHRVKELLKNVGYE